MRHGALVEMGCALVGLGLAAFAACDGDSGAAEATAGSGGAAGTAGSAGAGGVDASSGGTGAIADAAPDCQPPPAPSFAPGVPLGDPQSPGAGPCAGTSLYEFLAAIYAAHPELSDIKQIWKSEPGAYDGTYVFAYLRPDGGFSVALKRGSGDCPAGCIENEYWYFDADATCAPEAVGHFKPTTVGGELCIHVDGEPMWGHPKPIDPVLVCNADLTAKDISGSYQLWACGKRSGCGQVPTESAIEGYVTVLVAQNPADLSQGTVTLSGLGFPSAENVPLPAKFEQRRFTAFLDQNNLPSACPQALHVSASYDFEGHGWNGVSADQLETPDCGAPEKICARYLQAIWFEKK